MSSTPSTRITLEQWVVMASSPISQLSTMGIFPVVPLVREDLRLGYTELGVVIAAFGVARLAVDLPAGGLARRFNGRTVLIAAYVIGIVATLVGITSQSAWQLGLSRVLAGVSSSLAQAMVLTWLVGSSAASIRGRVMAFTESFFSILSLVVPAMVGFLALTLSWRASFVLGIVGSVSALLMTVAYTSAASARSAFGHAPAGQSFLAGWTGIRVGGAVLLAAYLLTFLIFGYRQVMLTSYIPLLGVEQLGLTSVEVGIGFTLTALVSTFTVIGGGWLSDRIGRARVIWPGMVLVLVSQVAYFYAADVTTFMVIAAIQGVAYLINALPPSMIGDAMRSSPARVQAIAVYRLVADSGLLIGPIVVGIVLDNGGYNAAVWAAIVPTVLILLALVPLLRGRTTAPAGGE